MCKNSFVFSCLLTDVNDADESFIFCGVKWQDCKGISSFLSYLYSVTVVEGHNKHGKSSI